MKTSRRTFLRSAALAATATTLSAGPTPLSAKTPTTPPIDGLIDLHSHWFSPGSVELLTRRKTAPRLLIQPNGDKALERAGVAASAFPLGAQWFDLEARVRHLHEHGVAHQLISWPTTLGVDPVLSAAEARELWTVYNNELATAVRRYPRQFSGVATLSTADIAWSSRELARGHDELGLIGGVLPINVFATREGAQLFAPVLKVAQKYRSHLYLHTGYGVPEIPGQPPVHRHQEAIGPRNHLDTIWSFAAATITLAYTDFLKNYPDVTVQIAQLGGLGGISLVEELARTASGSGPATPGDFRQLFFDTGAGGRGPEAIALAVRVFGAERIVFGTDYAPAATVAPVIANVNNSSLAASERSAVFTDNARRLLASKRVKA